MYKTSPAMKPIMIHEGSSLGASRVHPKGSLSHLHPL